MKQAQNRIDWSIPENAEILVQTKDGRLWLHEDGYIGADCWTQRPLSGALVKRVLKCIDQLGEGKKALMVRRMRGYDLSQRAILTLVREAADYLSAVAVVAQDPKYMPASTLECRYLKGVPTCACMRQDEAASWLSAMSRIDKVAAADQSMAGGKPDMAYYGPVLQKGALAVQAKA